MNQKLETLISWKDIIIQYQGMDTNKLLLGPLKNHPYKTEIAAQIQGRKKAKNKLPTWFNTPGLIYPSTTSIEQASSESAANYKASMIKGNRILDGSGGMGIDAMAIAMANPKAIIDYLEPDPWLAELMRHNCAVLGTHNILVHNTPLNNFITQQQDIKYDAIYIDPSRRDDANNRLINLELCEPNVVQLMPHIREHTYTLWLKTSPMMDIHHTVNLLEYVSHIYIVQWKQEVRELLFVIDFNISKLNYPISITCKDIDKTSIDLQFPSKKRFDDFSRPNLDASIAKQGSNGMGNNNIQKYVYLPAPALMKSGDYIGIADYYNIKLVAPTTYIYTSEYLIGEFMGHSLLVLVDFPFKELKMVLKNHFIVSANIVIKNAPMKNEEIVKKYKIKEGGDHFLIVYGTAQGIRAVLASLS